MTPDICVRSAFRISAEISRIIFTFNDFNGVLASLQYCPALGTFVLSVSGGGETRPYSLDLLEAETKIPAIKSA